MLSQVQKLEDLLILRLFNESVLDARLSLALKAEYKRQDECAERTFGLTSVNQ
jgi:hypothetical protein